jgi:hypothetical protein
MASHPGGDIAKREKVHLCILYTFTFKNCFSSSELYNVFKEKCRIIILK